MTNLKDYDLCYTSNNGAEVWVHPRHGTDEKPANLAISRFLADLGETILLLSSSTEPSVKNPDAEIKGEKWEFKTNYTGSGTSIDTEIKRAAKQADNILLFLTQPIQLAVLENAIYGRVRQCATLAKLRIIHENSLYEFTRDAILSQAFRGLLKKEKGA